MGKQSLALGADGIFDAGCHIIQFPTPIYMLYFVDFSDTFKMCAAMIRDSYFYRSRWGSPLDCDIRRYEDGQPAHGNSTDTPPQIQKEKPLIRPQSQHTMRPAGKLPRNESQKLSPCRVLHFSPDTSVCMNRVVRYHYRMLESERECNIIL